jgi:hypothetical protein
MGSLKDVNRTKPYSTTVSLLCFRNTLARALCREYAVWMVEVALKEANEASARAQMGFVWTLMHMDGEDREAGLLDHRFFLVLTIDPVKARKYMQSQKKPPGQVPPVERASPEEIEAASKGLTRSFPRYNAYN